MLGARLALLFHYTDFCQILVADNEKNRHAHPGVLWGLRG